MDVREEILAEMPHPAPENFVDSDNPIHHPVQFPANSLWVENLYDAKDELEVDGVTTVYSTWRVEAAGLVMDACMADEKAAQILTALPGGGFSS